MGSNDLAGTSGDDLNLFVLFQFAQMLALAIGPDTFALRVKIGAEIAALHFKPLPFVVPRVAKS